MNCPHCHSLMNIYQTSTTDKSQVSFYKCSVCVAQHVSSSLLTAGQVYSYQNQNPVISGLSSQKMRAAMF